MTKTRTVKVAVVGASGYTGGELLRLVAGHPKMALAAVTSEKSAGSPVSVVFPHLASLVPCSFEALDPEAIAERAEAVFLALPHTKSFASVATCLAAGKPVVDLSADYRLKNPRSYETWYQTTHPYPKLLEEAVYGLPELQRAKIRTARLVASPGCYATAGILQLAPLVAKGLVHSDGIIIDAKSGISGAGRSPALPYHFPEAHESVEAYKIGQHRHVPEIEQELSALAVNAARPTGPSARDEATTVKVIFTPHLVPMNRGILSTAYCRLRAPIGLEELRAIYHDYYKGERFVRLQEGDASANPRYVRGSNFCDLAVFADARACWVITVAALDNLVKGAAGQALQAMNLMLGFPEEMGLTAPGAYP
ncbi:MAG TPA: N-acetyl-gamma-glutamyl-phosphate reductase [Nitrospiraceae bacterium]|nr:N-acetyl-gamma-glutamyl-phosphate reductase [Nitrospiraceae bacterium]